MGKRRSCRRGVLSDDGDGKETGALHEDVRRLPRQFFAASGQGSVCEDVENQHKAEVELKEFHKHNGRRTWGNELFDALPDMLPGHKPMFGTTSTDVFCDGDEEAVPALQYTSGGEVRYTCPRTAKEKKVTIPDSCLGYIVTSDKFNMFYEALLERITKKLEEGLKLLKPVFLREMRKVFEAEYQIEHSGLCMAITASLSPLSTD